MKSTKILDSDSKTLSGGISEPAFALFNNFRKVEMLDHEYSARLTVASRPDLEESGRAFFVSGDQVDFLQEGFGIEL